jgi:hypothetical protein
MGVDAEMFVRIKGKQNWLSEDQVKRLSYEIGTAFPTDTFFVMNPRSLSYEGAEVRRALKIMPEIKDADDADYHGADSGHVGKVVWTQDGDPIVADDDEQFIKVNLWGRYYGPDYERGSWPTLRAIIFFLSETIPNGQVWYGGDSSGMCAERADSVFMAKMDRHWVNHARRPYVRYQSPGIGALFSYPAQRIVPPVCELCDVPMASCGGSRDYSFYWCDGCGQKASKHANGALEWAARHEDYPSFEPDGTVVRRKERA